MEYYWMMNLSMMNGMLVDDLEVSKGQPYKNRWLVLKNGRILLIRNNQNMDDWGYAQ